MRVLRRHTGSKRYSFLLLIAVLITSGLMAGCTDDFFPTEDGTISVRVDHEATGARSGLVADGLVRASVEKPASGSLGLTIAGHPDDRLVSMHSALRMTMNRSRSHIAIRY